MDSNVVNHQNSSSAAKDALTATCMGTTVDAHSNSKNSSKIAHLKFQTSPQARANSLANNIGAKNKLIDNLAIINSVRDTVTANRKV
ncbi:MAG: hypothetical protein GY874_06095 [Desulfobacteraceae bacterium]|nr:hypothetical protein [Desulfobacteraceae bacterium]